MAHLPWTIVAFYARHTKLLLKVSPDSEPQWILHGSAYLRTSSGSLWQSPSRLASLPLQWVLWCMSCKVPFYCLHSIPCCWLLSRINIFNWSKHLSNYSSLAFCLRQERELTCLSLMFLYTSATDSRLSLEYAPHRAHSKMTKPAFTR